MLNQQKTVELLRELENHVATIKIQVQNGITPLATVDVAQLIIADLLRSLGLSPEPIGDPFGDPELFSEIERRIEIERAMPCIES